MADVKKCAVLVRCGDRVGVRGQWLEVTGAKVDRFATGGAVVVLSFEAARPLRVPAFTQLLLRSVARQSPPQRFGRWLGC
ncbi:hypothetical protein NKH18_21150 [Streptomyces sp. M10(2022)]